MQLASGAVPAALGKRKVAQTRQTTWGVEAYRLAQGPQESESCEMQASCVHQKN